MTLRKNNKKVKIPIVRFTQEILDKYDYQLPKISNQKINEYLKILAKEAELTDGIILNDHKGKDTDGKIFIKHQVISFHAARKTFVMWSVDNGVSIETLEETVGDTYTSLKHYYEITETKIMGEYGKISESNMKVS